MIIKIYYHIGFYGTGLPVILKVSRRAVDLQDYWHTNNDRKSQSLPFDVKCILDAST